MTTFGRAKQRHKWVEIPLLREGLIIPERPQHAPAEARLFACAHCSWYRLEDKSPRGAADWLYWNSQRAFRWNSYYVAGRPKCGEQK